MEKWKIAGNFSAGRGKQARKPMALMAGTMALAVLAGAMAGCGKAQAGNTGTVQEENRQEEKQTGDSGSGSGVQGMTGDIQENQGGSGSKEDGTGGNLTVEGGKVIAGDLEVSLEPEDEYTQWEEGSAVKVGLEDGTITIDGQGAKAEGSTLTIDKGGTYVLKGTLSDGTVLVDAGDDDLVRLVFDGVDIHSETSAAVDIKNAGKTVISLEEGTSNSLSDGAGFRYRNEEKEEPNAALFSKDDLTINGSGSLKVAGSFNNGIGCKDILKIVDGVYEITAANHGVKGNDALAVYGGRLEIDATGDGLKSDTLAAVMDGDIAIRDCEEGIEAETVAVCGGNIDLTARDDGINGATDGGDTPAVYFMGGTVTVRAEGDGIDSNGSVYMSGGQVTVYGPLGRGNGALDYDRDFELTGGVLAAFGPGGMERNVSSAVSQLAVLADFQESKEAGTEVILRDKDGKELYRGAGEKAFRTVVVSVPGMEAGNRYEIEAGGDLISFVPEEWVVYVNKEGIQEAAAMGPGQGGPGGRMRDGQPGGRPEEWKDGERPEPPKEWEGGERSGRPQEWDGGERPERPKEWNDGEQLEQPQG